MRVTRTSVPRAAAGPGTASRSPQLTSVAPRRRLDVRHDRGLPRTAASSLSSDAMAQELSQEAYDRLTAELEELRTHGRIEMADKIERAREHGDLKENAEYHAAKEEKAKMEARVAQLFGILEDAVIVEIGGATDEVRVGTVAYRDPFLAERGLWDHAADRYSAAVTLHEIVTGIRPGRGSDGAIEIAAERLREARAVLRVDQAPEPRPDRVRERAAQEGARDPVAEPPRAGHQRAAPIVREAREGALNARLPGRDRLRAREVLIAHLAHPPAVDALRHERVDARLDRAREARRERAHHVHVLVVERRRLQTIEGRSQHALRRIVALTGGGAEGSPSRVLTISCHFGTSDAIDTSF